MCAYASDSVGWGVQPKAGKDEKERSRKGEAAIKSRIVLVSNCENNFKKVNAYWLQGG